MSATYDSDIERVLHRWSPNARVISRLGGGNRNEVWEVDLDGKRYAARASKRSHQSLQWEIHLLDFLASHGMYVPTALQTRSGHRQVGGLLVLEWLDGDPPNSDGDWHAAVAELEHLHELTRSWSQRPGFLSTQELLNKDTGGDVDLSRMPRETVTRIRAVWRALRDERVSVVHGDPGASNIRMRRGRVGLLDWDEVRVDASILDLAGIPIDLSSTLGEARIRRAQRAADAWEVANGWLVEPEYARRRLAKLDHC